MILYVGRVRAKKWLMERHCKYFGATLGMRHLKLVLERPADELYRDLLALDRKHCILITELLTGLCTQRWHINIMGPLRKHLVQEIWTGNGISYNVLYQCQILTWHTIEFFGFAWLDLVGIGNLSVVMIFVLALWSELSEWL